MEWTPRSERRTVSFEQLRRLYFVVVRHVDDKRKMKMSVSVVGPTGGPSSCVVSAANSNFASDESYSQTYLHVTGYPKWILLLRVWRPLNSLLSTNTSTKSKWTDFNQFDSSMVTELWVRFSASRSLYQPFHGTQTSSTINPLVSASESTM